MVAKVGYAIAGYNDAESEFCAPNDISKDKRPF